MATTYTTNSRLQKPATADRNWDVPVNANADALDAMTAIGSLAVTATETPSASLNVRVTAGSYAKADGTLAAFTGVNPIAILASNTTCLWLTDAGVPTLGAAFPTSAHIRLAKVISGPATITQVIDQRIQCAVGGTGLGFVLKAGDSVNGPLSVVNPSTGVPVLAADPTLRVLGFFGTTPTTQAPIQVPLTDSTTGTASAAIAPVGSSFSASVLNNNFASLTAQINTLTSVLKRHGLMLT